MGCSSTSPWSTHGSNRTTPGCASVAKCCCDAIGPNAKTGAVDKLRTRDLQLFQYNFAYVDRMM